MPNICAIVGIGPGNGRALVKRFSGEGYRVAMLSRNRDYLAKLEDEFAGARGFPCDAINSTAVNQAFGDIERDWGPVSTLVYNAGAGVFKNIEECSEEEFEHTWRVNTMGLMLAARAVLPQLRQHPRGKVLLQGDIVGFSQP